MKRTPLTRKTPLKNNKPFRQRKTPLRPKFTKLAKRRGRLKPMSEKRKKEGAEYTRLRSEFLEQYPACRPCQDTVVQEGWGVPRKATEVHHAAGRGRFYLRTDTWIPVCSDCHRSITNSREWSESQGYSYSVAERRGL